MSLRPPRNPTLRHQNWLHAHNVRAARQDEPTQPQEPQIAAIVDWICRGMDSSIYALLSFREGTVFEAAVNAYLKANVADREQHSRWWLTYYITGQDVRVHGSGIGQITVELSNPNSFDLIQLYTRRAYNAAFSKL